MYQFSTSVNLVQYLSNQIYKIIVFKRHNDTPPAQRPAIVKNLTMLIN
jgi:hypothetical protein